MKTSLRALLLGAMVAGCAACVPIIPPGALFIGARFGPPTPQYEVVGVAPGPGFIWIRGYYRWDGASYLWMPGHWERMPYEGAAWVPGRWYHHPQRGWYWVDGRWRGRGRPDDDRGRRDH